MCPMCFDELTVLGPGEPLPAAHGRDEKPEELKTEQEKQNDRDDKAMEALVNFFKSTEPEQETEQEKQDERAALAANDL